MPLPCRLSVSYIALIDFSDADAYQYCIKNLSGSRRTFTVDYSQSEGVCMLPSSGKVTKVVDPGETAFLYNIIANPIAESYSRRTKLTYV